MKAIMYEGIGRLSVREVEKPVTGDNDILVKILYSFICSTDIKTYKQGHPMIKPPTILGHECSGVITKIGKNVSAFHEGEYVTSIPYVNCGECEQCIRGNPEGCRKRLFPSNGALTEYLAMDISYANKGLARISSSKIKEAALAEPTACVLTSCRHMVTRIGDSALVVGAGIMGLLNALILRSVYGQVVTVTDIREDRLELPRMMGFETLLKEGAKYNSIILTAPIPELIDKFLPTVDLFGNMVLFGGYPKGIKALFDPNCIHYNGVKILGTTGFTPMDFFSAVKLIENGQINLSAFISSIYQFSDFEEAFQDAVNGKSIKVGIKVGE
jgi:L-iditol 2-dehydrogenase